MRIDGRKKRYLKLIGNPKRPGRVVLEGSNKKQNGIAVNDADEVTVDGFKARHYRANGFFFTNLNGYTMNHLVAQQTGVYGLYAFNTIGGRILNSEAYYVNDGAFYIGQTPPQDKPKQTLVRNVEGWGSPIGFSATNMRYVTITKSRFYNNAVGIVPNALDSEKFPPDEHNVIVDNDIFWNNLNFHEGDPPFEPREEGTAALVPIGTGILLLGGRDHRIEDNRIYGNFLGRHRRDRRHPAGGEPGHELARPQHRPRQPVRARRDRRQRLRRRLRRQRHATTASRSRRRTRRSPPTARRSASARSGKNLFSKAAQDQMVAWTGTGALAGWNKHAHPAKKGYKPLEDFKP